MTDKMNDTQFLRQDVRREKRLKLLLVPNVLDRAFDPDRVCAVIERLVTSKQWAF